MSIKNTFLTIAFVCLAMACGGPSEYILTGTARSAGTDGLVVVEDMDGGNKQVSITLDHLPPPARISETATVYVAWFQIPGRAEAVKAGGLGYDADDRVGSMTATTPEKEFTMLVTAETGPEVATPSSVIVAKQRVK